jgi:hypothetical protein
MFEKLLIGKVFGKQFWDQTEFATRLVSNFIDHLHDSNKQTSYLIYLIIFSSQVLHWYVNLLST